MKKTELSRRKFLGNTGLVVAGTAAAAGGRAVFTSKQAWAQAVPGLDPRSAQTLRRMARLLFPHDALADDVYAEIVEGLGRKAGADSALSGLLREGVAGLHGEGGDWLGKGEEEQTAALKEIEATPFFGAVHGHVIHELYSHRKTWALIGFPGSSIEYGGYINRGFDDIDWLPEDG